MKKNIIKILSIAAGCAAYLNAMVDPDEIRVSVSGFAGQLFEKDVSGDTTVGKFMKMTYTELGLSALEVNIAFGLNEKKLKEDIRLGTLAQEGKLKLILFKSEWSHAERAFMLGSLKRS